jgi:VWFA-related protein
MNTGVRTSTRRDILRWAAALAPISRLMAWQEDAKFSTDVKVVNVLATVRDKNGAVVKNLQKDDFAVDEEGHPQKITYFAQQSDLPLMLGLLVDTSGSMRNELETERRASFKFFEQVLHEDKDKAFVIHFDHEVELLQDLTSSRTELEKALDDLGTDRPQMNRRGQNPPQGGSGQGRGRGQGGFGGTALYDSVLLASDEIMAKQKGRKAVVLLSDGVDNGSKVSLPTAIESAQRADTVIYSIRFYDAKGFGNSGGGRGGGGGGRRPRIGIGGIPFPGQGGGNPGGGGGNRGPAGNNADGKKVLERLSSETGGSYFEVTSKMTLDKIYAQIQDELRNQYSIGYTSDQTGSGYRRIHISLKLKNMTVQARDGYYAG